MTNNVLSKLICRINATDKEPTIKLELDKVLLVCESVYSYLVYAEYKDDSLSGWQVEFLVSQTERFNTITKQTAIEAAHKIVMENWRKNKNKVQYVIGYKQPPIELLIEIFEPLIRKLAERQQRYWGLEYEDLCQMCRLVICSLHVKGYYIHKRIIEKAFYNYVLQQIRKERYNPGTFSVESTWNDGDDCYTAFEIPDEAAETDMHKLEEEEWYGRIIAEKKDLVIELIGERNYKQLLREYGTKTTTASSNKIVFRLKKQLQDMGITYQSFE